MIVTKVGAVRGPDRSWNLAMSFDQLRAALHDNLRFMGGEDHGPAESSIEAPLTALAELQERGLIRHLGLSNGTPTQVEEGRCIAPIVCVQNHYNLTHRGTTP